MGYAALLGLTVAGAYLAAPRQFDLSVALLCLQVVTLGFAIAAFVAKLDDFYDVGKPPLGLTDEERHAWVLYAEAYKNHWSKWLIGIVAAIIFWSIFDALDGGVSGSRFFN